MTVEPAFRPSRRDLLAMSGGGLGLLALGDLLAAEAAPATPARSPGVAAQGPAALPHHPPRAKRVIFLYMPGGPSHIDLLDPKPRVTADDGKPLPFEMPKLQRVKTGNLLASPWKFARHGQSGIEVSELLPGLASRIDEVCVIRSMVADNINHTGAALQICTGEQAFSRPSMGSWITYGLGTENANLPAFVVMSPTSVFQGAPLYSASFLPGGCAGTLIRDLDRPIANIADPTAVGPRQWRQLDALAALDRLGRGGPRPDAAALDARIASFELAFRMQAEAPEAFDLARESQATHALYGTDDAETRLFGRQCLLARRLVERGVRFVHVFDAPANNKWDQHGSLTANLPKNCRSIDRPVTALLTDLRARGLLDDTLVVWGGEFGRTPTAEGKDGREHHPFGFTMWMAGGGIKGGMVHGATDDYGWHAVQDKVHVHDLHATILHLLGIDHERLTYRYGGRDYRLTDVHGHVVRDIIA